jgi:predicted SprT family Zn-dependent metalloprotease
MNKSQIEEIVKNTCISHNIPMPKEITINPRLKKVLGKCRGASGKYTIELNQSYIENGNEIDITDTIIHEIAHGITPPGAHHGYAWKINAISLGAIPNRAKETGLIKGMHMYVCFLCGKYAMRYNNSSRFINANHKCNNTTSQLNHYIWDDE